MSKRTKITDRPLLIVNDHDRLSQILLTVTLTVGLRLEHIK